MNYNAHLLKRNQKPEINPLVDWQRSKFGKDELIERGTDRNIHTDSNRNDTDGCEKHKSDQHVVYKRAPLDQQGSMDIQWAKYNWPKWKFGLKKSQLENRKIFFYFYNEGYSNYVPRNRDWACSNEVSHLDKRSNIDLVEWNTWYSMSY